MPGSIPTVRPPPSVRGPSEVLVVRIASEGQVVDGPLRAGEPLIVGRDDSAGLVVPGHTISRRHALLVAGYDGELVVEDLGSANGTAVDGAPVPPGGSAAFTAGALLRLGDALGSVHAPAATGALDRPQRSEGTGDVERVVASLAPGDGACLAAFEGSGVEATIPVLEAVVPPGGHVARTGPRQLVVLLPRTPRAHAEAWGRKVAAHLAARRVYVAFRAAPEAAPGAQLAALLDRGAEPAPVPSAAPSPPAAPSPAPSPSPPPARVRAPVVGAAMRRVFDLVHQVAPTPTSVLILGETGAGKEVIARTIHARSDRASGPFVALNCAALPEALLEGELFGYEKGAFTGATQAKPGLVETAAGGTLFLDELGEMPLPTQSKLLRVLEDGAVLRLGSVKTRPVSFRLLAATNRDVQEEIRAKRFRADLYYRINGLTLRLPPLRERRDELHALVDLFARRAAEKLGRAVPSLAPEVDRALHAYDWPGNVRELRNVVERLVLLAEGGVARPEHLPEELTAGVASAAPVTPATPAASAASAPPRPRLASWTDEGPASGPPSSNPGSALPDDLAQLERTRILAALEQCAGNQTRAAQMLGITRRVLIGRLERYGVARPRK